MNALFIEHLINLVGSFEKRRFLVAISGGMDSVILATLCKENALDFGLCHVNYHLRSEDSNQDAEFVAELAKKWSVPFHIKKADLSNSTENIQLHAREIRYAFFQELQSKNNYDFIMTAHHLDDVAETFLFNLSRGTGIDGLLGIPAINKTIIRPMLPFSKAELTQYAESNNITYREDSSNASDKYARNYLRHHVVPALKKQNPNFLTGLQMSISHLKAQGDFAKMALDKLIADGSIDTNPNRIKISADTFLQSEHPITLAYHWLSSYGFSSGQVTDFFSKSEWNNGATLFTASHQVIYDRGHFILSKKQGKRSSRIIFDPGVIQKITFNELNFEFSWADSPTLPSENKHLALFDADKINTLCIRYWKAGDRFQPKGMNGKSKTLKKYFTDQKFSIDQKDSTPILLNGTDIIWIVGHRVDERYTVTKNTKKVFKVELS